MYPDNFLRSLYYGEGFCTKLVVNSSDCQIEIHINLISIIRDKFGEWNYYSDEDIKNAAIIITNVKKIVFDESGLIPNDQIYAIHATKVNDQIYEYVIETSHVDENCVTHDLILKVIGGGVFLLDTISGNQIFE